MASVDDSVMRKPRVAAEAVTVISADDVPGLAIRDLCVGFSQYGLWSTFAYYDIRQRFRRSVLGPLWLTASMGIMVGALGLVFGFVFRQPIGNLLPYIATGIIFWGLLTSCIIEATNVFVSAQGLIRNVPLPLSTHIYRMIARNIIIWAFNMVIYFFIIMFFSSSVNFNFLLFFPAFVFFLVNITWMSVASSVISTRYRDIPQIITNLLQVVFFVTPVFWSLDNLPNRPAFVTYNPLYHLIEIVREPLLGRAPSATSWAIVTGMAVVGSFVAFRLYRRGYSRIPYWV